MRLIVQDIIEGPMGYHELRCTVKGWEDIEEAWEELEASTIFSTLQEKPSFAEYGHPKQQPNEPTPHYIQRFFDINECNVCLRIDEIRHEYGLIIVKVWFMGAMAEAARKTPFDLGSRYKNHTDHVLFDLIMKEEVK